MDTRVAVRVPDRPPAAAGTGRAVRVWNIAVLAVVVVVFAVLVWHRRWMSDDGLIVLRTVRQLLAGEGPVFNAGARVEANTSTLWTYLVALAGLVPGVSLNRAAVLLGLACSAAGLGLALDAARRLHGGTRAMLPFGALVVVALPPFWDFGTSGLETGLVTGWLGLTWWLLVRRLEARRRGDAGRAWPAALVLGLAPLIRPDLALFGLLAGAGLVVLEARLGGRRIAGLAAVAAALPVGYEVFRAGYYGLLVPTTALAKEAADPRWRQGLHYLTDLVDPYRLWFPLAVLAVGAGAVLAGRLRGGHLRLATAVVVAVPGGAMLPRETRVLDGVGLVNPLAAHATRVPDARIGHDKELPLAWFLADAGIDPDAPGVGAVSDPAAVRAALAALRCERTAELLASVRDPLTPERFWRNLAGAWERTQYRYPRDPALAADCRTA